MKGWVTTMVLPWLLLLWVCLLVVPCCRALNVKPPPPPSIPNHCNSNNNNKDDVIQYEVIGSSGRIGSQFMRWLGSQALALPRGVCPGSSTPAGTTTTCILVCTPSSAWNSIYQQTLPERRGDLVFCGNGWLDAAVDADLLTITTSDNNPPVVPQQQLQQQQVTQVIPHYAVATVGGPVRVETTAPPTYIYGKYATQLRDCLLYTGRVPNVEILESVTELRVKALQKLLWTSCFWLLCHVQRQHPLTVGQVYEEHVEILVALVHELWPKFQSLLLSNTESSSTSNVSNITMAETLQYLQDYSLSIPDAIPSWELAMEELTHRNRLLAAPQQPLHRTLLEQVAGSQAVAVVFDEIATDTAVDDDNDNDDDDATGVRSSTNTRTIDLRDTAGIAVYGNVLSTDAHHPHKSCLHPQPQQNLNPDGGKNIVVIGSGIVGTSVAYHLALFQERQQQQTTKCKITVVSEQSDILDSTPTTRASWAWINANQKFPLAYQQLNSLGMHAWRNHPLLRQLPTWQGSLVQLAVVNDQESSQLLQYNGAGHYAYHSPHPLSQDEWRAVEPNVEFATSSMPTRINGGSTKAEHPHPPQERPSTIYSFPNEGCVDPIQALFTLRKAAVDLGVEFVWNQNVTRIIESNSNDNGENSISRSTGVTGVECVTMDFNDAENNFSFTAAAPPSLSTKPFNQIAADMVVVAAGTGSERLAGLAMMHSPGGIVSFQPPSSPGQSPVALSKIVVDTVGKSHVLQRRDGRIVAGGGALEFGGTNKPATVTNMQQDADNVKAKQNALWSGVCAMVPKLSSPENGDTDDDYLSKRPSPRATFAFANRPIPQDGLPAVGFVRPGVYTVVTHSGVTLAPLLGPLAAQEIMASVVEDGRNAVDLDLLAPYRPTRFSLQEQSSQEENGFFKMLDEKIKISTFQLSLFAPWVGK